MSRQRIASQYLGLVSRWPQDILRPEVNFQNVLRQRAEKPPVPFRNEEKEIKSALLLLEDGLSKRYPLPSSLMKPASSPEHYTNLKRELEEAPHRSWFSNFTRRMRNMVRLK